MSTHQDDYTDAVGFFIEVVQVFAGFCGMAATAIAVLAYHGITLDRIPGLLAGH